MKGRRIPVPEEKLFNPLELLTEPGDYIGPFVYGGEDRESVCFLVPAAEWADDSSAARFARVASPPHVFRECPDGSLEIRQSILVTQRWAGEELSWHGYLDEGHEWRTV